MAKRRSKKVLKVMGAHLGKGHKGKHGGHKRGSKKR
jgi:hypothetical protein